MKEDNHKSKMIASVLATLFLTSPLIMMPERVFAQANHADRHFGTNNGQTTTIERDQNWRDRYIGKPSFKLRDDNKMKKLSRNVKVLETSLSDISKVIATKEKELKTLTNKQEVNLQVLIKLQKEVLQAVEKKSKLQKEINVLKASLPGLKQKMALAKSAVDATATALATAAVNLSKAIQRLRKVTQQCSLKPSPACQASLEKAKKNVERLTYVKKQKEILANAAVKDLNLKKKDFNKANNSIAAKKTAIMSIETQNSARATKMAAVKARIKQQNDKINVAKAQLAPFKSNQIKIQGQLNKSITSFNSYRKILIRNILRTNHEGKDQASYAGRKDGLELARGLGSSYGQDDGQHDGGEDGLRDGKDRDYNNGYAEGINIGANRARVEGERNGSRDGRIAGNTDAGNREGNRAGINRAEQSDATSVGQRQGSAAGMDRAINTGKIDGIAKGEAQAISKYESRGLQNATIKGPYAGTFERRVPSMPAGHVGPNYHPDGGHYSGLMYKAFNDGYIKTYRAQQRRFFENTIATIYNRAYDIEYQISYDFSYRGFYREQFDAGQRNGDQFAFERDYRGIRDSFFNQARENFSQNPDRSSQEYKSTYASSESDAFGIKYEQIRRDNYDRFENDTFSSNISSQTEKFRTLRYNSVTNIYENNSVLNFVSSNMKDAGINGVAVNDGIFQPGEATVHDVVVTNFGKKAATNATVTLADGQKVKLPSIPASSKVTVVGALKGSIANARAGSVDTKTLRVYSPLTAEAKIQGRHYANPSQGLVNNGDQKRVKVQFPLALSRLLTNGTAVINEPIQLLVDLANNSSRKYSGPLKIEVTVNSNGNIITKTFNDVQTLDSTLRLKDAQVKVTNESDVYTPLTFSAKISKNGVLLGTLDQAFNTMVKAPFKEKPGKPVVVVNSEDTRVELLDTLAQLGGISNASVLDLSLTGRNGQILKQGLKNKTALVIDQGNGSVVKNFDHVLAKSENNVFIFVDQNRKGLELAMTTASFKDAGSFSPTITGTGTGTIVFTNPHQVKGLKGSQFAMQADLRTMNKLIPLAELYKTNATSLLASLKAKLNRGTYFKPSAQTLQTAEIFNIKGLSEIVNLNKAYKESGGWLGGRDKKIAKKIYKDKTLHFNVLRDTIKSLKLDDATVGMYLFGVDAKYTLYTAATNFDDIDDDLTPRTSSAAKKSGSYIEDEVKKQLKKFDSKLYKKVYANKGIYTPFTPGTDTDEGLNEWSK
jgi:predicted  nucleic acid-binding Zn-ribbon protein